MKNKTGIFTKLYFLLAVLIIMLTMVYAARTNGESVLGVAVKSTKSTTSATTDPYQVGRDTILEFLSEDNTYTLYDDTVAYNTGSGLTNIKTFTYGSKVFVVLVHWDPSMDFKTHTNISFDDSIIGKVGVPELDKNVDYDKLMESYNDYFIKAGNDYLAKLKKKYGDKFADHIQDLNGDGAKSQVDVVIYAAAHPDKDHQWYGITALRLK